MLRRNIVLLTTTILLGTVGCERPLTFDERGVAHGTGEKVYTYKSGRTKLREAYANGTLVRSRWYSPDGALIQETKWIDGTGEGIYLRDDGTIRTRMRYVHGLAEGDATEYDAAGRATAVTTYHGGQPARPVSASTVPTRP